MLIFKSTFERHQAHFWSQLWHYSWYCVQCVEDRSFWIESLVLHCCRHTTFMIHFLHQFMTLMEKRDISQTLEQLTTQTDDGNCQSLALDNGMILPPVPLTTIPYVKWVTRLQIWCRLLNSRALIYLLKKIFQMLLSSCIWCLLCLLLNK